MKTLTNPKVKWSGRGHLYSENEIAAVVEAMRSADPQSQGKYLQLFESKFKEYLGYPGEVFATSSCSGALQIASMLMKLKAGDEVILPAHTFAASAVPFLRTGAKLVWADINPDTRVICADSIKKLITPNTKAIVVVHLYGLMADMDPIMELAAKNDIWVLEDAAQSLGAEYKGRKAGTIGDMACFSFQSHKNITTLGEGGMLALRDEEFYQVARGLRHNGMRPFTIERPNYWTPTMTNVDLDWEGFYPYKFCLGEAQCALGAEMLKRLDEVNATRRSRAERILAAFKDYPELTFQKVPADRSHVYHLLSAKYDGSKYGKTRDDFLSYLAFEQEIQAIVQYYPLYRYPMFIKAGFKDANCPVTDNFYDNMISLPFQHHLTDSEIDVMIASLKKTLDAMRK